MNKLLQSFSQGSASPPLIEQTLHENLEIVAQKLPDKILFIDNEKNISYSYKKFLEDVNLIAKSLIFNNIKNGDRVGIQTYNHYEWLVLLYSCSKVGAILVNLNPAFQLWEFEYIIPLTRVKLFFVEGQFRKNDLLVRLNKVKEKCDFIEQIIQIPNQWEDFKHNQYKSNDLKPSKIPVASDPVCIFFSYGFHSTPQAVVLSHYNILNNAITVAHRFAFSSSEILCNPLPFYHGFGLLTAIITGICTGNTIVIPSYFFESIKVMESIQKYKCTVIFGVPAMFKMYLSHNRFKEFDYSSLRTGIIGGAAVEVKLAEEIVAEMKIPQFMVAYGLTEVSPCSLMHSVDEDEFSRINFVGNINPHSFVKIVDNETHKILPINTTGELYFKGYFVALGYWTVNQTITSITDKEGWLHTGDYASINENGQINIKGLIKRIIIRGGENISLSDIEQFMKSNEYVDDVVAVGLPSIPLGQELLVWIKLKSQVKDAKGILFSYCKENLAFYKIPKFWKFVDSFPLTTDGQKDYDKIFRISIEEYELTNFNEIITA